MPLCCPNCFNDIGLKEYITSHGKNGVCSYCNSDRIHCLPPDKIRHLFEFFSYCIETSLPEEQGYSYSRLIQDNFFVYSGVVRNIETLTRDILGPKYIEENFKLKFNPSKHIGLWDEFKSELKFENRFFPKNSLYSSLFNSYKDEEMDSNFSELLSQLTKPLYSDSLFYRARISDYDLSIDDMKMPPMGSASGGRANPIGISYLYLASNIDTCIAEVRPSN